MTLGELIEDSNWSDLTVSGISEDSRTVQPGDLFIAASKDLQQRTQHVSLYTRQTSCFARGCVPCRQLQSTHWLGGKLAATAAAVDAFFLEISLAQGHRGDVGGGRR